jgi:hypothetical protein
MEFSIFFAFLSMGYPLFSIRCRALPSGEETSPDPFLPERNPWQGIRQGIALILEKTGRKKNGGFKNINL